MYERIRMQLIINLARRKAKENKMGNIDEPTTMREKYWSEKNDTEKIEALKRELRRTQKTTEELCVFVCKLLGHQHGENKLLTEITIGKGYNREPIFFRSENFDK